MVERSVSDVGLMQGVYHLHAFYKPLYIFFILQFTFYCEEKCNIKIVKNKNKKNIKKGIDI